MSGNKRKHIFFVRWGGLSALRQKHYETDTEEKTFHNPPVKYGIYALPEYTIEMFLVAGMLHPHRGRAKWLKDENGEKVVLTNDDSVYDKEQDCVLYIGNVKKQAKKRGIKLKTLKTHYIDTDDEDRDYMANVSSVFRPKKFKYTGNIWSHLDIPHHLILRKSGSWILSTYLDYLDAYHKEISKNNYTKRLKGYSYCKDHFEVFIPKNEKYSTT
jgi:hypothetical protein